MRIDRRRLAGVAAALGLGLTGCQTWMGGMTLPSPRYLQHYPQYIPPDPNFPLPRELATQTDPTGAALGGAANLGPVPVPPAQPAPVDGGHGPNAVAPPK